MIFVIMKVFLCISELQDAINFKQELLDLQPQ